jgi:kynurenine formamidase
MQFDAARQAEILAAISGVAALVTDSTPVDDLLAQLSAATAERDAAVAGATALQARLDAVVAGVQALNAADALEDEKRAAILAAAQGA